VVIKAASLAARRMSFMKSKKSRKVLAGELGYAALSQATIALGVV